MEGLNNAYTNYLSRFNKSSEEEPLNEEDFKRRLLGIENRDAKKSFSKSDCMRKAFIKDEEEKDEGSITIEREKTADSKKRLNVIRYEYEPDEPEYIKRKKNDRVRAKVPVIKTVFDPNQVLESDKEMLEKMLNENAKINKSGLKGKMRTKNKSALLNYVMEDSEAMLKIKEKKRNEMGKNDSNFVFIKMDHKDRYIFEKEIKNKDSRKLSQSNESKELNFHQSVQRKQLSRTLPTNFNRKLQDKVEAIDTSISLEAQGAKNTHYKLKEQRRKIDNPDFTTDIEISNISSSSRSQIVPKKREMRKIEDLEELNTEIHIEGKILMDHKSSFVGVRNLNEESDNLDFEIENVASINDRNPIVPKKREKKQISDDFNIDHEVESKINTRGPILIGQREEFKNENVDLSVTIESSNANIRPYVSKKRTPNYISSFDVSSEITVENPNSNSRINFDGKRELNQNANISLDSLKSESRILQNRSKIENKKRETASNLNSNLGMNRDGQLSNIRGNINIKRRQFSDQTSRPDVFEAKSRMPTQKHVIKTINRDKRLENVHVDAAKISEAKPRCNIRQQKRGTTMSVNSNL